MSLNVLDVNENQMEKGVTQVNPDEEQMMQDMTATDETEVQLKLSTTSDDAHLIQKISVQEDSQPTQPVSTSNGTQMKDFEYQSEFMEADTAKTSPMIRNEEDPTGSVWSVSKTEATHDNICRKRPIDMTNRQILKNVIALSIVFFLTFMAYGGLVILQSSLHVQQGMGVIALAIVYGSYSLSCLTLPKAAISLLGHKWCMSLALVGFLVWMATNGFGVWLTVLPASIIVGICGSILWTAQSSYLTILARHYAVKTNQQTASVTSFFFGIFTAIFVSCAVFGSIISSTILGRSTSSISSSDYDNQTSDLDEELLLESCGLNDCPGSISNTTLLSTPPPTELVWTLVGVYVAIATVGFIICCVFVDPLPKSWARNPKSDSSTTCQMVTSSLLATVKQMRHVKQLLLIPITIYLGFKMTFQDAEYTRSFLSCFLAIWMVGWCMIPSSIARSLVCFISGRITKYIGVLPVLACGLLFDLSFQLTLWLWTPSARQMSLFFIAPVFTAMADSVWIVQIRAVYGVVFSDDTEAAFSCLEFLMSCGQFLAFGYSSFLCTRVKLQILTAMLALGFTLVVVVILVFRRNLAKPLRH